ncbi:sigma-70 family RNA polymerase sigma factor [Chitinophaga oryziterrae]|uniref:Sigma-70 family RNA polymerase sigma factor n=1 Tax=Chitinophaga oryziterrae TaxID=1031224 RepID=A0A6N8J1G5_9BACT|nr:sigma-70 family RNA polymerase sigma factor [Chitinophaga oryziterrae]MVT39055.1 sigma-70 family RNA polymerase sigma factor [Chitinophaga oryziterrae]
MHQLENEKELLQRIAGSSQEAFKILHDHYARHVYGLALRLMKSPELAQDLTQEIFVRVWVKRELLSDIQQFRPWLNTISRNMALDYLRKKVAAPSNEEYMINFFSDLTPSAEENLALKQLEGAIRQAVDQLSPQLKTAFTLSRFQGLTHMEIAQRMNISPITSKSHLVRALAIIRKYLEEHYPDIALVVILYLTPFFFN